MKVPLHASCDDARCSATETGTRAELEAAGWVACARKGGKIAWLCPAHDPTKKPRPGNALSTGDMVEEKKR